MMKVRTFIDGEMGFFYLLHEYADRYHSNYPLGKKFARTVILGFIFYYLVYFVLPLYIPPNFSDRFQHFIKYLIVVDIIASSIFYGGVLNGISFWSRGAPIVADLMTNNDDDEVIILGNSVDDPNESESE